MRESSLAARLDASGTEVLVVHRPVTFTLDQVALAMHAVVDPHLLTQGSRARVGRIRVREVVRQIATEGWPEGFAADTDRVAYWRSWLVAMQIFTDDIP